MKGRGEADFGLLKVPDSAIIADQEIEIGKLKSYIQELEDNAKKATHLDSDISNKSCAEVKIHLNRCREKLESINSEILENGGVKGLITRYFYLTKKRYIKSVVINFWKSKLSELITEERMAELQSELDLHLVSIKNESDEKGS